MVIGRASLLVLGSCEVERMPIEEADETPVPPVPYLEPTKILTRTSLDLRGVRPSPEELAAVGADPTALEPLIESFVLDERLGARIRDLAADRFRTRFEGYYVQADEYGDRGADGESSFRKALGDEPLHMLTEIALNDLPYTDLVLADWAMANEFLGEIWPNDYPEGGAGWLRVHHTDGRPAAGVLVSNALWMRNYSTISNTNRGRANTVSRLLLCSDYLQREVEFDLSAATSTGEALESALKTNPGCVSCHSTLDPLAGYFYGFWWYGFPSAGESTEYHPERELLWQSYTGVAPGYFGEPGHTLRDLAEQIADDPRFVSCAVEQFYGDLLQRELTLADTAPLAAHREAFIAGGLTLRSLFASLVEDSRYRADGTDTDGQVERKLMSPELLQSQVQDLTGFTWTYANYEMLGWDEFGGVRVLAGGADGDMVSADARTPSATQSLVIERLAQMAAGSVVTADAALAASERRLFTRIEFDQTPTTHPEAFVAQVVELRARVLSQLVSPDSPEVAADIALWESLYALDGQPAEAWRGLLTVLMRDPDFVAY